MESPEAILDALLYSVSHDLRSPLLTLSLSAELIRESMQATSDAEDADIIGSTGIALDALKQGAADLERMLKALTTVSRARRRQLDVRQVPLRTLVGGHDVLWEDANLEQRSVPIDATPVRELIDRLCGEEPAEIRLAQADAHVVISIPSRAPLPALDGSPLIELARSLQIHAGTVVEELAALQIQLARLAIAIEVTPAGVRAWLPLAAAK